MKKKLSFLFMSLFLFSLVAVAQVTVKGTIIDKDTKETLIGVSVFSVEEKKGAATDLDGTFSLKLKSAKGQLKISYIGFTDMFVDAKADLGIIELESSAVGLSDVVITSSMAIRRKTPVALTVIEPEFLETKLSSQEFPEILKSTPSVYVTKQGGGYGDSRINMRGFSTENIAIMINGIPMNDMEWGGVYWSNLGGLSDVTRTMQVQRGLGAAKVAAPSIGGSINIVTKAADATKGGSVGYTMGNDGYNKLAFNVSTGLSKNGWAMTILGSRTWADGYVQATDYEAYTWFANITKIINDKHQLSLTAFGAPQWHNQRNRSDKMLVSEWQKVNAQGRDKYKFNPTFGYDENGKPFSANRNSYHKPQFSLNHYWTLNDKSNISTSLYASLGAGAGRRFRGKNYSKLYGVDTKGHMNMDFRQTNTLYRDYGAIQKANRANANGSDDIISESINNHTWLGLLSTYSTKFGEYVDFSGGVDLRYYAGVHKEKIKDLMGGEFFIDTYRKNVSAPKNTGAAFENQKLKPGDKIYRDNTGYVVQAGVYSQAEYNKDALSAFVSGSLSNSTYWKEDRFYYDHEESKSKNFIGFNIKGGANYNIDKHHNVFFNTGYLSRAPYMRGGYFSNIDRSNEINPDAVNEKSYSFEIGYGYQSKYFTANVNLYHTMWLDKTMVRKFDGSDAFINLKGVDAKHQGIEFEFTAQPIKNLKLRGTFSIGDWKWNSKATGFLYDDQGNPSNGKNPKPGDAPIVEFSDDHKVEIDMKGVRVGNSAQTKISLGGSYTLFDNLTVGADYTYEMRNYADYKINVPDPGGMKKYYTPWRIPSYGTLDLNANYKFDIGPLKATIYGNVNNVFNQEYIADAVDYNADNPNQRSTWDNVGVFYGFGRTYTVSLKVKF